MLTFKSSVKQALKLALSGALVLAQSGVALADAVSSAEANAHKLVAAYFAGSEAMQRAQKLETLSSLELAATEGALTKLAVDCTNGLAQLKDANYLAFAALKAGSDVAIARSSLSRALLAAGGRLSAEAQSEYDAIAAALAAVAPGSQATP